MRCIIPAFGEGNTFTQTYCTFEGGRKQARTITSAAAMQQSPRALSAETYRQAAPTPMSRAHDDTITPSHAPAWTHCKTHTPSSGWWAAMATCKATLPVWRSSQHVLGLCVVVVGCLWYTWWGTYYTTAANIPSTTTSTCSSRFVPSSVVVSVDRSPT